jgi:transposase InsO family protein
MRAVFIALLHFILSFLRSRQAVALEIVALRHQLGVLQRQTNRPRLTRSDRMLWVALHRLWPRWRQALVIVKPATVIAWHRAGFRAYWARKSRPKGGRPRIEPEIRKLIRQMWLANPTWGRPRIQAELAKIGIRVSDSTVRKYKPKRRGPPSQTWRTFLENHLDCTVGMDFFVVVTATFRILYVLVIVSHERRRILYFNVTSSPSAQWTAQQVVQAFPFDAAPRFLLRDRDRIYGAFLRKRIRDLGIEEVLTAYRSPWQNPYCERWIGTVRRDCLDHLIVWNEAHLRRTLHEFLRYYHADRTHQALANDCPESRPVEPRSVGRVVEFPRVGGLHHRYTRRAA